MMYQARLFAAEQAADSQGGGTKIPVGIHSDGRTVFNGISTDATWSDINFSNQDGRSIHKRLFVPTGSQPKEGEGIAEAKAREEGRNIGHVVQLMTALLAPEVVEQFEAADYKSFIAGAALLLNGQKGVKINLKVVPDWKEGIYPDLPSYGTYVERYVAGVPATLKFSKKEAEAIAQMEDKRTTTASSTGGAMSSDDLESLV